MPDSAKVLRPKNQIHNAFMLRLLEDLLPQPNERRLLDFGCGGGQFLLEASQRGFDPFGLEINKDLAEFVTDTYGFSVHQGVITDPEMSGMQFDVIVSSQVFEHLTDPKQSLKELVSHISRPGLILIEVPNLRHFREVLKKGSTMDDSHLFYFNTQSLTRMMTSAGLQIVEVQEGLRLYRWLPHWFPSLPDQVHRWLMRLQAKLGVRTGLSVIGCRPA